MANTTRINGRIIETYPNEESKSILGRYASEINSLPKYLYLEKDFKIGQDNKVVDFLNVIKQSNENPSYTDFFENYKVIILDKLKKRVLNFEHIVALWIAYNDMFKDLDITLLDDFLNLVFLEISTISQDEKLSSFSKDELEGLYHNKQAVLDNLEDEIKFSKKLYEKRTESKIDFTSIKPVPFTNIDIQSMSVSFTINVSEVSLSELFNDIILSNETPFVYYKNFFKILKNFKVDETWYEDSERDEIVLYVNDKISEENYNRVVIDNVVIDKVVLDKKFKVEFDLITKKGYIGKEQFIERILKILNISSDLIGNITQEKVAGLYEYNNIKLNSYVFADLVLNDNLFSNFISVDESTKATKKQTSSGERWIYIHFNDISTGHISAGITQKVPDDDHDEPYLRINFKAKDNEKIIFFQTILGKLLSIYETEKNNIIKQYKEFIKDFQEEKEFERRISRKTLKKAQTYSEIKNLSQITGYSRQCLSYKNLQKIEKKEYDDIINNSEKTEAIEFPRSKTVGNIAYPSDGNNVSYYKCVSQNNDKYSELIYPGIQKNTTNKFREELPYLPCCFKTDQTDREYFKHYYKGEELSEKKGKQQELIKTEKILEYNNFGNLPDSINNFFKIFDPSSKFQYLRFGMDRNQSSFISCVLTGILDDKYVSSQDVTSRKTILKRYRTKEFDENVLPLSRQCTYDIPENKLKEIIQDMNMYFDPRMFIQLIQEYFDINIIVFDKNGIVKPYYSQKYYYNFKKHKQGEENYIFI